MWTRKLLKKNARIAFHRNFISCVLVCLIAGILGGGIASASYEFEMSESETTMLFSTLEEAREYVGGIISTIPTYLLKVYLYSLILGVMLGIAAVLLVSNVVQVGRIRYFLENREHKTDISKVFYGFKNGKYMSTVGTMFCRGFYIWAWSLLFVIPGIIKTYSYLMVPSIIAENPNLDRKRVFEMSRKMMRGHKWEAFVLDLSFIGWQILSAISGGLIGMFYVAPYISATHAELYSAIKEEAKMKGLITNEELPGFGDPEII